VLDRGYRCTYGRVWSLHLRVAVKQTGQHHKHILGRCHVKRAVLMSAGQQPPRHARLMPSEHGGKAHGSHIVPAAADATAIPQGL
jgi:hypothetical protein